jgi:predicted alpha/beta hydrolase family esterase
MKRQVLVIHGGDFFDTRKEYAESLRKSKVSKEDFVYDESLKWKDNLARDLGKDFEVLFPTMPSKDDARYEEWKIWFEKIVPFLEGKPILVGHSLGGIFLARYLNESLLPVKIRAFFLVAAPYFEPSPKAGLKAHAGFSVRKNFQKLQSQTEHVFIYHSQDDKVVSPSHARKYKANLPQAELILFEDKGHFRQTHFSELVTAIQALS